MDDTIFISQSKYVNNIVKKFGQENASQKRTPTSTHLKLTKDEKGVDVDQSLYRSMIGSILYLTTSRSDITFAVGVCARYQAEPKISHITQVKRIFKYINRTSEYGMMYSYNTNSMLVGYCNADWEGSADDRKITYGGCFFLGNNPISWFNNKQNCVSLSTTEAEYIAAGNDLDSDDEPIGKKLAPGIAKRLKNRKGKVIVSTTKLSNASKKSVGVGPAKEWSKVVTPATKKRSMKRKEMP
ncbi:uncharacterized mitochondrial protein AtMg00810-like [Lathyrus oleraceus]|uniref:uncharacterized mitochondrial protein AtMg00810-like n=1 Tax=Pisum sativum TaxID=3888 RepID=UPI0021D23CAE|nr:uncharacterized mitochondrial protein AtMg00810-like [Pisum sativum]